MQRLTLESGKIVSEWIDEEQLRITSKKKITPVIKKKKKDPGGSGDVPTFSIP